jgi:hypothetical protein
VRYKTAEEVLGIYSIWVVRFLGYTEKRFLGYREKRFFRLYTQNGFLLYGERRFLHGGGGVGSGYAEWQWPLSGVHSIMMVKSPQSGGDGGACPPPFTLSTITSKEVLAQA